MLHINSMVFQVRKSISVLKITIKCMYCTALYCTVLYCTKLHCTVLYNNVPYTYVTYHFPVFLGEEANSPTQNGFIKYCTVLYCVLYRTILHCTVFHNIVIIRSILFWSRKSILVPEFSIIWLYCTLM